LTDINTVDITFPVNESGTVVVAKGGHLVSGSLAEEVTISDTFTSTTSKTVTHNFNTKNVIVSVYDENDNYIIPANINLATVNSVVVTFSTASTGTVVVAKGGHKVSGVVTAEVDWLAVSSSILPETTEVFDLGSPSKRWRDLYLSGSTIDLGGTLITRDASGDINFKDSQTSNLKRVVVDELQIGTGETARKFKVDNGRIKFTDVNDVDKVDTSLSLPAGTVSGSAQITGMAVAMAIVFG